MISFIGLDAIEVFPRKLIICIELDDIYLGQSWIWSSTYYYMYYMKCDQGGTFSKGELKGFGVAVNL
jgi:hypothetical protein